MLDAERHRGNHAHEYLYDWQGLRGDPPHANMRYPMDRRALEQEFDFGDRLVWVDEPGKLSYLLDNVTDYYLYDGNEVRGRLARRRLAAWWREWNRHPRPCRRVEDAAEGGT